MSIIHFLNVNEGDCSLIEHFSGHKTVIDVSNATSTSSMDGVELGESVQFTKGNYNQKAHPVNPIKYMQDRGVTFIFRFILTHPDMDHMSGIKDLFASFGVENFWDTANNKVMEEGTSWGQYKKEDWDFYQSIRNSNSSPKTLNLYAGSIGQYYNRDENNNPSGDGLYILAPTFELVSEANRTGEYNDCSYAILYKTIEGKKIVFAGDSAAKTWDYIIENHEDEVKDVDVLLAPHHGRKTGGNGTYLDILNPKLTLFGNAKSQYLDYNAWNNRGLYHITNNQANCIILVTKSSGIEVYVTNEKFAKDVNPYSLYSKTYKAWYLKTI